MYNNPLNPETGPSSENPEDHETTPDILLAIQDPNNPKLWYTRGANDEKIPINTQEDNGKVREVLIDGTFGREVRQNPFDDPIALRGLYQLDKPEQPLPSAQKTDTTPIALATESLPDDDPIGKSQSHANALTDQSTKINNEITDAAPTSENNAAPENPAQFAENATAYHEKLQNNLSSITATLMQKADTLGGLGMTDAAAHFAKHAENLHSTIQQQIDVAGNDYSTLCKIYAHYFKGDPTTSIIAQIESALATNSSTTKFEELLSRTTTIPELSHIADALAKARNDLKIQKLAHPAGTPTTDFQIPPTQAA